MAQYRMLESVEAFKIEPETVDRVVTMFNGKRVGEINPHDPDGRRLVGINVPTIVGIIRVSEGDYLVKFRGSVVRMDGAEFERSFVWISD